MIKYFKLSLYVFLFLASASGQETEIQVHFLYGSKPKRAFKKTEPKWFGGKLGGHVGVGISEDKILNFVRRDRFHLVSHKKKRHSAFMIHNEKDFYNIFSVCDSAKKTIISIPITQDQKRFLDSLEASYLEKVPYDYAFLGMRCAAATYDILSQLGFLKRHKQGRMVRKIFYPKKLRKRLFKLAYQNNWPIRQEQGTIRRKWERDGSWAKP